MRIDGPFYIHQLPCDLPDAIGGRTLSLALSDPQTQFLQRKSVPTLNPGMVLNVVDIIGTRDEPRLQKFGYLRDLIAHAQLI